MANLHNLINLAKADGGKFFVIDEQGEAKLVILPIEEYQRLLLQKLKRQVEDVERVNREIIQAQLREEAKAVAAAKAGLGVDLASVIKPADMRDEAIDPSFDFEEPKSRIEDL